MADTKMVKVTVLLAFPLNGVIIPPGEREVPADKVARLVEKKVIAAPAQGAGSPTSDGDGQRTEAAISRISAALMVERVSGEEHAAFLERLADRAEKEGPGRKAEADDDDGLSGLLPDDFPHRSVLEENKITTWEALQAIKSREDLIALKGIAETRADEISAAVKDAVKQASKK